MILCQGSSFFTLDRFSNNGGGGSRAFGVYMTVGTWMICSTILNMVYTCNLVSHLINPGDTVKSD